MIMRIVTTALGSVMRFLLGFLLMSPTGATATPAARSAHFQDGSVITQALAPPTTLMTSLSVVLASLASVSSAVSDTSLHRSSESDGSGLESGQPLHCTSHKSEFSCTSTASGPRCAWNNYTSSCHPSCGTYMTQSACHQGPSSYRWNPCQWSVQGTCRDPCRILYPNTTDGSACRADNENCMWNEHQSQCGASCSTFNQTATCSNSTGLNETSWCEWNSAGSGQCVTSCHEVFGYSAIGSKLLCTADPACTFHQGGFDATPGCVQRCAAYNGTSNEQQTECNHAGGGSKFGECEFDRSTQTCTRSCATFGHSDVCEGSGRCMWIWTKVNDGGGDYTWATFCQRACNLYEEEASCAAVVRSLFGWTIYDFEQDHLCFYASPTIGCQRKCTFPGWKKENSPPGGICQENPACTSAGAGCQTKCDLHTSASACNESNTGCQWNSFGSGNFCSVSPELYCAELYYFGSPSGTGCYAYSGGESPNKNSNNRCIPYENYYGTYQTCQPNTCYSGTSELTCTALNVTRCDFVPCSGSNVPRPCVWNPNTSMCNPPCAFFTESVDDCVAAPSRYETLSCVYNSNWDRTNSLPCREPCISLYGDNATACRADTLNCMWQGTQCGPACGLLGDRIECNNQGGYCLYQGNDLPFGAGDTCVEGCATAGTNASKCSGLGFGCQFEGGKCLSPPCNIRFAIDSLNPSHQQRQCSNNNVGEPPCQWSFKNQDCEAATCAAVKGGPSDCTNSAYGCTIQENGKCVRKCSHFTDVESCHFNSELCFWRSEWGCIQHCFYFGSSPQLCSSVDACRWSQGHCTLACGSIRPVNETQCDSAPKGCQWDPENQGYKDACGRLPCANYTTQADCIWNSGPTSPKLCQWNNFTHLCGLLPCANYTARNACVWGPSPNTATLCDWNNQTQQCVLPPCESYISRNDCTESASPHSSRFHCEWHNIPGEGMSCRSPCHVLLEDTVCGSNDWCMWNWVTSQCLRACYTYTDEDCAGASSCTWSTGSDGSPSSSVCRVNCTALFGDVNNTACAADSSCTIHNNGHCDQLCSQYHNLTSQCNMAGGRTKFAECEYNSTNQMCEPSCAATNGNRTSCNAQHRCVWVPGVRGSFPNSTAASGSCRTYLCLLYNTQKDECNMAGGTKFAECQYNSTNQMCEPSCAATRSNRTSCNAQRRCMWVPSSSTADQGSCHAACSEWYVKSSLQGVCEDVTVNGTANLCTSYKRHTCQEGTGSCTAASSAACHVRCSIRHAGATELECNADVNCYWDTHATGTGHCVDGCYTKTCSENNQPTVGGVQCSLNIHSPWCQPPCNVRFGRKVSTALRWTNSTQQETCTAAALPNICQWNYRTYDCETATCRSHSGGTLPSECTNDKAGCILAPKDSNRITCNRNCSHFPDRTSCANSSHSLCFYPTAALGCSRNCVAHDRSGCENSAACNWVNDTCTTSCQLHSDNTTCQLAVGCKWNTNNQSDCSLALKYSCGNLPSARRCMEAAGCLWQETCNVNPCYATSEFACKALNARTCPHYQWSSSGHECLPITPAPPTPAPPSPAPPTPAPTSAAASSSNGGTHHRGAGKGDKGDTPPPPASSSSSTPLYAALGAVGAVVLLGVTVGLCVVRRRKPNQDQLLLQGQLLRGTLQEEAP